MSMSAPRRLRMSWLFAVLCFGWLGRPSYVVAQQESAPARADDPTKLAAAPAKLTAPQSQTVALPYDRSVATPDGRPDLTGIVRRLGELEITSLLIEGGALVNWAALASGVVDKVFLYYAPKILAGSGSVPFAAGAGFRHMSDAAYVKSLRLHRFGEDFAVEGYLRDPYA